MGDASDNIKGVEGIGEKGARDLMEQYGTLENLLAHRAELKRKAHREGLEAALPRLTLVRRLVTVVTDLALPLGLDDLAYKGVDQARARAAFKQLGFEALTKEFTAVGGAAAPEAGSRTWRRPWPNAARPAGSAWTPRPPASTPPAATSSASAWPGSPTRASTCPWPT
jgi:DNA polymerase-1